MNLLELRLPSLTGSDPETQLLQLRSYLYQLTEQLQLALGTREETAVTPDTQKLLREAVALSAKRGDGRYAGLEALEGPWRQLQSALDALQAQLPLLKKPGSPELPAETLCRAGTVGMQIQQADTVCFLPLPPFVQTSDGHWQIP